MPRPTTLESHVAEERRRGLAPDAAGALLDLAGGVRAIVAVLARAMVCGAIGSADCDDAATKLTALANGLLLDACAGGGNVAVVASTELPEPKVVFGRHAGRSLVTIAPLDGAPNLAVDGAVGTIFSVLRPGHRLLRAGCGPFLQPGAQQVAAGYALYGPCTMLVATAGRDVNGFTLDPATGALVLTHPRMRIPEDARELEVPWAGSEVADVHRLLVRGGTLVRPAGAAHGGAATPRLVFEASPMALLVERAGGMASTGRARLLDLVPRDLHERVPIILGARREVERLVSHHADPGGGLDRRRAG